MDTPVAPTQAGKAVGFTWPGEDVSRVPFQVYTDQAIYEAEQRLVFQGPTWNLLCVEAEIPTAGDYRTSYVGNAPVIVNRDETGRINALLNRCVQSRVGNGR